MKKIAIKIKNLHLSYKVLQRTSIKNSLFTIFQNKMQKVEVLKGINLEVESGEVVGIVGKNGSGKSTLLRAIAGIIAPDKGRINLNSNSVSLLALGVGFNEELTGYDNIFLSGMLLGLKKEEIQNKLEEIIEFSELEDYINKPVRTYSSGMRSKLAFSITAILETDIILIDEVLSVGDINFKEKSYKKIKELILNKDKTILLVSHENNVLLELCNRVVWINDGKIMWSGKPEETLDEYEKYMK